MKIEELGELFSKVQSANLLGDGKTFPDCIPNRDLYEIQEDYEKKKNSPDFDLRQFVLFNFTLPRTYSVSFSSNTSHTTSTHISSLWHTLTRNPTPEPNTSLIPLPFPYVVPGGRFREIYYWDSYFTMLGLKESGRIDLIENMVDNFAFLINTIGHIPNGNRSYFLSRSQPPFFSLMVDLLAELRGSAIFLQYKNVLEKEYSFWMDGAERLSVAMTSHRRVVLIDGEHILNRYWDDQATPRPESYKEDVELAERSSQNPQNLFRNIRAAAESGWDFSSRWYQVKNSFESIHTTEIIPVDLNCLLYHLEIALSKTSDLAGDISGKTKWLEKAEKRKTALLKFCWNTEKSFFTDYDWVSQNQKDSLTLAGLYPLFFNVASADQAQQIAALLEDKFLKAGGLRTTLQTTGQQWDAPNGWAPLQWICYRGLLNYGFTQLAGKIKHSWLSVCDKTFAATGKMMEKYNAENLHVVGGGGEYPNQDGFGWTNGVYLAMKNS